MSIYTECSAAARELAREGDAFTELDVVRVADPENQWNDADRSKAHLHAPMILRTMYTSNQLCRYGPVPATAPHTGREDYARGEDGKIIYAHVENGPYELLTPNGRLPSIYHHNDPISRPGRPPVSIRNDLEPWGPQYGRKVVRTPRRSPTRKAVPSTDEGLRAEVISLRAELEAVVAERDELRRRLDAITLAVA
jgi:hypothetical protein